MKLLNNLSLPVLLALSLVGCGGGSGGDSATDTTDDVHSAIFSNPAYIASWGDIGVFTDANTCSSCHTGTTTVMNDNGKDVSPYTRWKHSTMANSLNDPYFNAVVEEEGHIFPDKKVFIEDTCLRCHSPMAYTHAHQTGTSLVADPLTPPLLADGGYPFETAISDNHAREGVACTACHQIQPDNLGTVDGMSGHYKINTTAENTGDPIIFGPFTNLTSQPMINNTQYTPAYAAHIAESAMCASCHNLYTPTLDLNGNPVLIDPNDSNSIAQFPEQTPYWEWLNSDFSDPTNGKTCQACHMAEPYDGYRTVISTKPSTLTTERPDTASGDDANSFFGVHEFVGGNSYLLTLLKTYMAELGLGSASGHTAQGFQDKVDATKAFLSTAASVNTVPQLTGTTLTVPVTITNHTGHKLPTSYPSRRMWVHLKVTDSNGATVFESGAVDSIGRIALDSDFTNSFCLKIDKTEPGFDYSTCYEPHHDTINSADQVAIYEGVLGDVNQDITHVLLHARQYIKDNRIPPKGWTLADQHTNPADTNIKDDGIIGTAETDANFAPGKEAAGSDATDTVTYNIDVSAGTAPFSVTAELYYQTIKPSFVLGMHADDVAHGGIAGDSYVGRFKEMYEKTPPITETLASQTVNNIN